MISIEEKKELLRRYTNMSEFDIKKYVKNGAYFYPNNEEGYKDFFEECVAGLCAEEDIPDMWEAMDVVGNYRVDFAL